MRDSRGRTISSSPRTSSHSAWISGCLVKNRWPPRSKRNPSRSSVRARPPTSSSRSSTVTPRPRWTKCSAAVRPAGPAPRTITSSPRTKPRGYRCAYDPTVEASAVTTLPAPGGGARRAVEVIGALTRSDLRVRYGRGRTTTIKWILDPFAAVGVYLLLVAFVLDKQGYAVGLSIACAVVPFQLVMMTIINALRAVDLRRSVITNMAFDKSLIPVASMCTEAVGFSACFVLLAILMAAYGVAPTPWILMLPVVVLVTLFFATACAFPAALIGLWMPELTCFVMSAAPATYFLAPGLIALRHIYGHTHDLVIL